ncbi:hypothetical protein IFM12275_59850 [Nocardia sputorum]|uniref:Uncharacterized protein n=1 Tax=Nocardia sputorum TaxID=2984338 RepID=A0ABN6TXU4_9NOCA|nr:hypothetical protein IFM12275_59850 [Nocardia sputorum]BDT97769.1 hypothetical protein IFM12276_07980 [Nocardia sputorum]
MVRPAKPYPGTPRYYWSACPNFLPGARRREAGFGLRHPPYAPGTTFWEVAPERAVAGPELRRSELPEADRRTDRTAGWNLRCRRAARNPARSAYQSTSTAWSPGETDDPLCFGTP